MRAVQVEHQPVSGGRFGSTVIEGGHQLVVAVHEVYLEALDTHLRIVFADPLHITVESPVPGPEDDAYVFRCGIVDDSP